VNKKLIINITKSVILILMGACVLQIAMVYFVNIITGFKLDWYVLTHPHKWLTFGFIFGFPLWQSFALASVMVSWCLFWKIIEVTFNSKYAPLKKTGIIMLLFLILMPILTIGAEFGQKFVMKHAFDFETKKYVLRGLPRKYKAFTLKKLRRLSDERINQMLAENFFSYLTDEETHQRTISSALKDLSLRPEYSKLVNLVTASENSALSMSYRSGPEGLNRVKLLLSKEPKGGLTLRIEVPRESIFKIDSGTGKKILSETNPVFTIRDHDLDGMPEDFNIEPLEETIFERQRTEDGFVKFTGHPKYRFLLNQWSIGINFFINRFIHGLDSELPL